ncbi:MAG: ABC transporter permease [Alphaproteobacteria bacterium]|nr:MAG: ABC transporter permease [Alphaproteobacteria bacterium]
MGDSTENLEAVDYKTGIVTVLREKFPSLVPIIVSHALVILAWYLIVKFNNIPAYILPSPGATIETLFQGSYAWGLNTFTTVVEIYGGYVIAVAFGIGAALIFYWFRWFSLLVFPLFVTLSMVPKIALGPLFVVWFSYGVGTNIFIAFVISFFPMLLTTLRGLREVEPELLELVQSLKATRWQIFMKIQLPNSLPYIFSGMKVSSILAVAGAIVGEFIASENGLGYLMIQVQAVLDTAAMFMAVILLSLVGVALYLAIIGLERLLVVQGSRID